MRDYKKLDVWKKAHLLTKQVYNNIVPLMPSDERFALTSQLRRSAYSIPLNIVEGCGRNTDKDFAHFLDNTLGSALEVEYSCFLIYDLNYISEGLYNQINAEINEIKAMLISFYKIFKR